MKPNLMKKKRLKKKISLVYKKKEKVNNSLVFSCVVSMFMFVFLYLCLKTVVTKTIFSATLFPLHLNVIVDLFESSLIKVLIK